MDSFPQRKNPRLDEYDYSQDGVYFVTICTHQRKHLFGIIHDDNMQLNSLGKIAHQEIEKLTSHWQTAEIDSFVVMPNHVHIIISINNNENVEEVASPFKNQSATDTQKRVPTLGNMVGNYKAGVTRRVREKIAHPKFVVWQSRYHDHIIRDEESLNTIRNYVLHNPELWQQDKFYG